MAKQVRTTGVHFDDAWVGNELKHLRAYKEAACKGCPLETICQDNAPEGGPWFVLEASPEQAVDCRLNEGRTMVPIRARKRKDKKEQPPQESKKERWVILLDANVFIGGALGQHGRGLKAQIMSPPPKFEYWTTRAVFDEVQHLADGDLEGWLARVEVIPTPAAFDERIQATLGSDFTSGSVADASLFQCALDYPEVDRIVSNDNFHLNSGLLATLGLLGRVHAMKPRDYTVFARRHRQ